MKKVKVILIIVSLLIISLPLIYKYGKSKNELLGTWVSDGGTIYKFNKANTGYMKTSLSKYDFTYKIKDNVISIDFKEEKAIDTDYEYNCKKDKCTLKSDRGTFTFTKKK